MRTFDREADAGRSTAWSRTRSPTSATSRRAARFWVRVHLAHSDFDPGLWFLAAADGGRAGRGRTSRQSGPLGGYVAQLAVRRDQRGRGLGLALLRHGFGELHRRGVREVYLDVDSQNRTSATRLYERAGMRVSHRYDNWVKNLGWPRA